jgi:hypothetical protein
VSFFKIVGQRPNHQPSPDGRENPFALARNLSKIAENPHAKDGMTAGQLRN